MYNYLIPNVLSLPVGYDCTFAVPPDEIARRLRTGTGAVVRSMEVFFDGERLRYEETPLTFRDGALVEGDDAPIHWPGTSDPGRIHPGYMEIGYHSVDRSPIFAVNRPITPYAIYSAPGKKCFFSDNSQKFSNPVIIDQIAKFGRYVDGYPVVQIDQDRDYGESLILINPYKKPVLASVHTPDGRTTGRTRVSAMTARRLDLAALLEEGERRWVGRIQLTANNRLIPFNIKHSFADPTVISDHEHFDPFRGDPTHMPFALMVRVRLGAWLGRGR